MATLSKPEIVKAPVYDLASIARSIYESFNKRDLDRAVSALATECEFVDQSNGLTMHGPAGLRDFMQGWARAFPDARVDIKNVVVNGDLVTVECIAQGTHTGVLASPDGKSIGPTGRRAQFGFCDVLQLRSGKVVRGRSYYDMGSILRQLGLGAGIAPIASDTSGIAAAKPTIVRQGEGRALWMLGGLYEIKATSKGTQGQMSVVQMTIPSKGIAPRHVHDCAETVCVLKGELRWHVGEPDVIEGKQGDVLHFPKGTLEWYENASANSARVLVVYTPGGMDEFFAEAADPARARALRPPSSSPPDVERLTEIAARHGLTIKP